MRYSVTTRQGHQIIYSVPHGARVDVGYWDLGAGADATKLDEGVLAAACARPPDFVITYPLDGSGLSWQHWTAEGDLHPNSADHIEFAGGVLKLVQYQTADWTGASEEKTVRFTPGPDAPRNLVSRITGVHDRKAPWKATLADLFGAAFKEFTGQDCRYSSLYSRYMGVARKAPNTSELPGWREVDAADGLAALGDRDVIHIGVFPTEPYYYRKPKDPKSIEGFEYELGNALTDLIGRHYGKPRLRAEWKEETDIELPGDGTDNDVLFAELKKRLEDETEKLDLIFSAILTTGRQDQVAFACNSTLFHIDAIYTGRGDFGKPPTGSLDRIARFLAEKSRATGAPILLVHTAAKDQTKAAGRLVRRIRELGGACEESTITLPEIPAAVNPGEGGEPRVHVYVGDMIQIQRMSRGPGPYPIDLAVNLYTDHHDVVAPLFLAPFGKKNS